MTQNRLRLAREILAALFGAAMAAASGAGARADIEGDATLVEQACAAYERNVAALRTWAAEIEVQDARQEGKLLTSVTSAVTFAYDRDKPAWTFDWQCVKSLLTEDGRQQPGYADGNIDAELMVDGKLFKLRFYEAQSERSRRFIHTSLALIDHRAGDFEYRVVPHQLFWYGGNDSFAERQRRALVQAKSLFNRNMKITRDGDLLKINYRADYLASQLKEETVIDVAQGGSRVSHLSDTGRMTHEWRYEVEEKNGVWVPTLIHHKYDDMLPDGGKKHVERRMIWKKNVVNEPLDPQLFTLTSLRKGQVALLQTISGEQIVLPGPGE
jgi:hypothetical protein